MARRRGNSSGPAMTSPSPESVQKVSTSSKEALFYRSLRDIFIGAKVEGASGFINLIGIKSKYYENGVFPKLKQDIEDSIKDFPQFREELFDKLYTFFHRYFSESGSIYFRHTPLHQNIYERVYTDDKDVMLFWKTHMLYYVKTDRLFKNLEVELDGFKFFFDASTLEHKKANEKREIIYEFREKKEDGTLVFNVFYSEKGRKTRLDEILKNLKKDGHPPQADNEELLERAFRVFEKQSEVDYFINKNAKAFLQEQFNLWLYQYVFTGESVWAEERIRQLQALKDIAFKIIDFISQFEDELVRIWNKPKFVLNSNYVIALDKIAERNMGLVERLIRHENFESQIKEWKELEIVNDDFKKRDVVQTDLMGKHLKEGYHHLPIDTKYFKDLELEILGLFDDLDQALDGWLIKSENYQTLKTILPKFRDRVQTIYIDPPFNKEQDADYLYNVKYKDSTWASILENRLRLARDLLSDRGSIFVRCDYNGNWIVRCLMDEIWDKNNLRNELVVNRISKKGFANRESFQPIKYPEGNDYLFFYSNSDYSFFNFVKIYSKSNKEKWHSMDVMDVNPQPRPRIILGKEMLAPKGRKWMFSQENIYEMEKQGLIRLNSKGAPQYKVGNQDFELLDSKWTDIPGYSFGWEFPTENSEILLKRAIESTSNEGDLVMDFFLGSGTTTAVAHKLKRKWLGVEMGEHFYNVVLPRMKKVLAYDKSGISKEVKEYKGGGFFKYCELEQYEDTLRKAKYEDSDLFENPYQYPYNQYVFMRDLKMLSTLKIDYQNNKVKVDLARLYKDVDVPETLSNLLGKWIKRITPDYVEFEDGERADLRDLDWRFIKPYIWW